MKKDEVHSLVFKHLEAVLESPAFRSSPRYATLLKYLVRRSLNDETPHEIDIAVDCFDKDTSWDPTENSSVRVSVHQLRKKLEQFYSQEEHDSPIRLSIPRGSYRVSFGAPLVPRDTTIAPTPTLSYMYGVVGLIASLLTASVLLNITFLLGKQEVAPLTSTVPQGDRHFVWDELTDGPEPILIALGDFFTFTQSPADPDFPRFIRDVRINSAEELRQQAPDAFGSAVIPSDQSYLPKSSAFALDTILPLVYGTGKPVSMKLASDLTAEDLRNHHVIYIGFLRSMGVLREYFFRVSNFSADAPASVLEDKSTGETYRRTGSPFHYAKDYGLFANLAGPEGGKILLFAGLGDIGVLHAVRALTDPAEAVDVEHHLKSNLNDVPSSFEILFEVSGYDRADLGATIKTVGSLSAAADGS